MSSEDKDITVVQVHTGNILSLTDLRDQFKEAIEREFVECVRLALVENYGKDLTTFDEDLQKRSQSSVLEINRGSPFVNVAIEDLKTIRTTVKVFVTSFNPEILSQAVKAILKYLDGQIIENIVLAYTRGPQSDGQYLSELEVFWKVLEDFVAKQKISRLGIGDVTENIFIELYNRVEVKPSILHINISSCCVVPKTLEDFTKNNEIQLIMHGDPSDLLSDKSFLSLFQRDNVSISWGARYLSRVPCRGVLVSKGYIVCANVGSS